MENRLKAKTIVSNRLEQLPFKRHLSLICAHQTFRKSVTAWRLENSDYKKHQTTLQAAYLASQSEQTDITQNNSSLAFNHPILKQAGTWI